MNTQARLGLILIIGAVAVTLILIFTQNSGQKPSVTGTPPATGATVATSASVPVTGASVTPNVSSGTPGLPSTTSPTTPVTVVTDATAQPTPATTTIPAAAPTMTVEEQRVMEEVKGISPQSEASSPDQCSSILQTQPWCSITKSAKRIMRPEWEELFPQAEFFLVEYTRIGRESQSLQHVLVIEQNGQRYSAETFDHLLSTNSIVITDTNRELVAKAFGLINLPDYLESEVSFTAWEKVDMQQARHRYNYCLTVWTKIQGNELQWCFVFSDGQLKIATGPSVRQSHVGDYIDVPFEKLSQPSFKDYIFAGD